MASPDWSSRADFSVDRTNWIQVPFLPQNQNNDVVSIRYPARSRRLRHRLLPFHGAPWANNYICGWGLSTTNGPPLASFPRLAAVPDQQVLVGNELLVTNMASEPYASPQDFTFTLLSGPNGAALDPQSGVFRWRPMLANAPATVPVVVKVADRGTPEMSATQQFWIDRDGDECAGHADGAWHHRQQQGLTTVQPTRRWSSPMLSSSGWPAGRT